MVREMKEIYISFFIFGNNEGKERKKNSLIVFLICYRKERRKKENLF